MRKHLPANSALVGFIGACIVVFGLVAYGIFESQIEKNLQSVP